MYDFSEPRALRRLPSRVTVTWFSPEDCARDSPPFTIYKSHNHQHRLGPAWHRLRQVRVLFFPPSSPLFYWLHSFGADSLDSWRGAYLIFSLSIRRLRSVRRRFLSRLAHFLLAWRSKISYLQLDILDFGSVLSLRTARWTCHGRTRW